MKLEPVKEKCSFLAEITVRPVDSMIRLYCLDMPKYFVSTQNLQIIFMPLGTGFMIKDSRVVYTTTCLGSYFMILIVYGEGFWKFLVGNMAYCSSSENYSFS